jgi:hypothetical protein
VVIVISVNFYIIKSVAAKHVAVSLLDSQLDGKLVEMNGFAQPLFYIPSEGDLTSPTSWVCAYRAF